MPPKSRDALFDRDFLEDLRYWVDTERKTALRLLELVEAVLRDPFAGIGKPEPLRHVAPNTWSRRLTGEHRLVHRVFDDRVHFHAGRYHY